MSKRILITGVTGLLGTALQKQAVAEMELFGVYFPERSLPRPLRATVCAADVTDGAQMRSVFELAKPEIVIHTASIGSVDYAEKYKEQTRRVNVGGTQVVVELCREVNARLVFISSNAVFDGEKPFYAETDPVHPINFYGQLKVEGERLVQTSGLEWIIVRPILMYGWPYPGERDNPAAWWVRTLRDRKPLRVVDNVYSKPLFSEQCADVIWAATREDKRGLLHVAGKDHLSLYNFAVITAEVFGLDQGLISPVPDSYFTELAPRPRDTSFATEKMEREWGIMPLSLRDGLQRMKDTEDWHKNAP